MKSVTEMAGEAYLAGKTPSEAIHEIVEALQPIKELTLVQKKALAQDCVAIAYGQCKSGIILVDSTIQ